MAALCDIPFPTYNYYYERQQIEMALTHGVYRQEQTDQTERAHTEEINGDRPRL